MRIQGMTDRLDKKDKTKEAFLLVDKIDFESSVAILTSKDQSSLVIHRLQKDQGKYISKIANYELVEKVVLNDPSHLVQPFLISKDELFISKSSGLQSNEHFRCINLRKNIVDKQELSLPGKHLELQSIVFLS